MSRKNLYVIEFDAPGGGVGHAYYSIETAKKALELFWRDHPEARDIREMRRPHVGGE